MRPRLVFIDDDPHELADFKAIVSDTYDYPPIQWPLPETLETLVGEPPAIFVLDLYFPSPDPAEGPVIPEPEQQRQETIARNIARKLERLYPPPRDTKELLRNTFACIQETYDLLWDQCRALGQLPETGRSLLAQILNSTSYRRVPIVFYSRKVTVEEAVRALQAGAVAVIPKPKSPPDRNAKERVLAQLSAARSVRRGWRARLAGLLHLNVNLTMFSQEFVTQKADFTAIKVGP
jgi:CheY-like chemotaxis protein